MPSRFPPISKKHNSEDPTHQEVGEAGVALFGARQPPSLAEKTGTSLGVRKSTQCEGAAFGIRGSSDCVLPGGRKVKTDAELECTQVRGALSR